MSRKAKSYEQLLEQDIALVESLCEALQAARTAIVACKIHDLEESIGEQRRLHGQLVATDQELLRAPAPEPASLLDGSVLRGLRQKWQESRTRLHQLNVQQEAWLHRSQRTLNAVLNGFRTFAGNYAADALRQTPSSAMQERA